MRKHESVYYGYIRVSSKDQNMLRQRVAIREAGVPDGNIFMDSQSGKNFNRPGYRRVLRKLRPDDVLVVKSIDRLGRNYEEILEQWRIITKDKRAAIVILDMPLLDTRRDRDLTGMLIADIVLQLLSYVAQTEREMIRQRQLEGITAAKLKGVHFGRVAMERPPEYEAVYKRWKAGEISSREAGDELNLSHQTFLKWTHQDEEQAIPGEEEDRL